MTFVEAAKKAMEQGGGYVNWHKEDKYRVWEDGRAIRQSGNGDCGGDLWTVEAVDPVPDTSPQPELMTMAQAIAKAVEMGGGEVCWNDMLMLRINPDATMKFCKSFNREYVADSESYTVRPLPPADFDFTEALECLKRGDEVIMQDNGHDVVIQPYMKCSASNSGAYVTLLRMKDKRFRKA